MHIEVNGTRLWFDVDGPGLVPDGKQMRHRPTVVLVHGGPGVYDHSYFKPDFSVLAAQTPVAAAEEIASALPEGIARLEIIDGAGHFAWLDSPDRYWPMIIEFISRTTGSDPPRRKASQTI